MNWQLRDEEYAADVTIRGVEGGGDDGRFAGVVRTRHESARGVVAACTGIHRQDFTRRIGGVRFVEAEEDDGGPRDGFAERALDGLTELGELARAMTFKAPLVNIPADGEKSIVYCESEELLKALEPADKATILDQHLQRALLHDRGIIFGPDINCNEEVMSLLAERHGRGDHVSGLAEDRGGFSIDKHGFTAHGLDAALGEAARLLGRDLRQLTMTIQGFGAVGANLANIAARTRGIVVRAATVAQGGVADPAGLAVPELYEAWRRGGDHALLELFGTRPSETCIGEDQVDRLFEIESEIFVPAARTKVLATQDEVDRWTPESGEPRPFPVETFHRCSGVQIVLEGANKPLSDGAERYLEEQGVVILPDFLVNSGGLMGCWEDWVYRGETSAGDVKAARDRAIERIRAIVAQNVRKLFAAAGGHWPSDVRRAVVELARLERERLAAEFRTYSAAERTADHGRALARRFWDAILQDMDNAASQAV